MGEHTPGPWMVADDSDDVITAYADDYGRHLVVAEKCGPDCELVAAAPDLLQMLERIVNAGGWYMSALELEPDENGEDLEAEARKAITKAKGEANE